MLMMLGPLRFEVVPFNAGSYDHGHAAGFAEKPVLGARPPLEFVGAGPETWTIKAKLFPETFGGLSELDTLYTLRASGAPHYMMRGDGAVMGWVVIRTVTERSSHLGAGGVGRVIDVDIEVARSAPPSATTFFARLARVFLPELT
jgi:hypothetical protein